MAPGSAVSGGSTVSDKDDSLRARASIATSVINLINNTVGAGLFSLPWCLKESTMLSGLILIALMGALNGASFILLAECCELAHTCSYLKMMKLAFGDRGGVIAQICVLCYGIGSCISFVVLTGDFLCADETGLFIAWASDQKWLHSRAVVVTIIAVTIFLPLSMLRNLAPLRYTSFIALAGTIYAGALCVWGLASDDPDVFAEKPPAYDNVPLEPPGEEPFPEYLRHTVKYVGFPVSVFAAIPLFNVAFTSHYNAPRYYAELADRSVARWRTVIGIVLTLVLITYVTTGVTGYLTFGEMTKGDILRNFNKHWTPAIVARLALALLVIFTFPMTCHFIRDSIIDLYYDGKYSTDSCPLPQFFGITLAITVVSCIVGVTVTEVEVVLSYKGAIFGSAMVYIFPPLMYALLRRRAERGLLWSINPEDPAAGPAACESTSLVDRQQTVWEQLREVVVERRNVPFTTLAVWGVVTGVLGVLITALKQADVILKGES